jgi:hypothetical protein
MRFSLRWLFGVTAFAAVACACLIFASESVQAWTGFALQLFLLLSALGAFYAPRDRRAFWGGCALMGWYYMGCAHLPPGLRQPWNMAQAVIQEIHPKVVREVQVERRVYLPNEDETTWPTEEVTVEIPPMFYFVYVGHTLVAFLAAFAGGGVALWFDRRVVRDLSGPAAPSLT